MKKTPFIFFIAALLTSSSGLCANKKRKSYSNIEPKIVTNPKVKSDVTLEFKVNLLHDTVMNYDENAPWVLQIKKPESIKFKSTRFERTDLDKSLPGFRIRAKVDKPNWKFDYRLVSFVCTVNEKKQKNQCYREVHRGSVTP